MDLVAIGEGLAAAAATVSSTPQLTATAFVPDSITEPQLFVAEPEINYDRTYGRDAELEFVCRLLVGRQDDRSSQRLLRLFLSTGNPESVKDAIESARGGPGQPALDGVADDLWVRRVERPRWYEHAGTQYVGVDIAIRVVE